jgi:chaperonin cofactor prefoldin
VIMEALQRKRSVENLREVYENLQVQSEELNVQSEELREAYEALQKSEKRFQTMANNDPTVGLDRLSRWLCLLV